MCGYRRVSDTVRLPYRCLVYKSDSVAIFRAISTVFINRSNKGVLLSYAAYQCDLCIDGWFVVATSKCGSIDLRMEPGEVGLVEIDPLPAGVVAYPAGEEVLPCCEWLTQPGWDRRTIGNKVRTMPGADRSHLSGFHCTTSDN